MPATALVAPGPKGAPLIGVLPQVRKDSLSFFVRAARDFGDVATLDFGLKKFLLVSSPDGLKHVLQDNAKNYVKGYDVVKPLLGEGLVTSDGDFWLRQRRLMQPAFHGERIKAFVHSMTDECAGMLQRWAQAGEAPVNVAAEAMQLTQTIIVKTMFSEDGLRGREEADRVAAAVSASLEYFTYLMFTPVKLPDWVPTATHLKFRRAVRVLEGVVYRLIAERRAKPEEHSDLLSMLVQAKDAETSAQMSDRQVRDEVMTIFLAGHETTATTLAWAWYLLSQDAQVAKKLEAEVDQVLEGRIPVAEDVPRLQYTRMVVDETMRLYPAAWMFARTAVGADEIGGYRVAPGAALMMSPYVVHRNPQLWPDPDRFDPQRFDAAHATKRHKFAYLPFSGGPRVCIGNAFALTEAVVILAMVAQKFRHALVPGRPVKAEPTSTLRPRPGVWMTLQPR